MPFFLVYIALASLTLLMMALVLTYILGWANVAFHIDVDPRIDAINNVLADANCGGCRYIGCREYAEAVVNDGAQVDLCVPGGASCATVIAEIMGIEIIISDSKKAIVHCGAKYEDRLYKNDYLGEKTCAAANYVAGVQACTYGCLGFGDCVDVCPYDAIRIENGLAVVDYEKCIGCGLCASACPRNIISIFPFKYDQLPVVACSNKEAGKDVKRVCNTGCIACRACLRECDLFVIENNMVSIDYNKYDPGIIKELNTAMEKCPTKAIKYIGKNVQKYTSQIFKKLKMKKLLNNQGVLHFRY